LKYIGLILIQWYKCSRWSVRNGSFEIWSDFDRASSL